MSQEQSIKGFLAMRSIVAMEHNKLVAEYDCGIVRQSEWLRVKKMQMLLHYLSLNLVTVYQETAASFELEIEGNGSCQVEVYLGVELIGTANTTTSVSDSLDSIESVFSTYFTAQGHFHRFVRTGNKLEIRTITEHEGKTIGFSETICNDIEGYGLSFLNKTNFEGGVDPGIFTARSGNCDRLEKIMRKLEDMLVRCWQDPIRIMPFNCDLIDSGLVVVIPPGNTGDFDSDHDSDHG